MAICAHPTFAQNVDQVPRKPYETVLEGLVDFNSVTSSKLPGIWYNNRLPFPGVIVGTYFSGQIPGLAASGKQRFGVNFSAPSGPLEVGFGKRIFSKLHSAHRFEETDDNMVFSHALDISSFGRSSFLGHGTLAVKFTNRQYVFGFDLIPIKQDSTVTPYIEMRFFDIEGNSVGQVRRLRSFGTFTFVVENDKRLVKGIQFTNMGKAPYAVDNIVFQPVYFIG